MSIQLQYNHKEICRICLKEGNLRPINGKYENAGIIEMLQTCFLMQIKENDGFPQKICLICLGELAQAYKLSKKFQTTRTVLNEQKPSPVTLIKTIDPDTNDDEFVLPDKSIHRKDIQIGNKSEFILIDKNIIKKIKGHYGQQEVPSPSEELKLAKMRIINAKSNIVEEKIAISTPVVNNKTAKINFNEQSKLRQLLFTTKAPGKDNIKTDENKLKESPGKINILSIKPYFKDLNAIRGDGTKNITSLQLNSSITNILIQQKNELETSQQPENKNETDEIKTKLKEKKNNTDKIKNNELKNEIDKIKNIQKKNELDKIKDIQRKKENIPNKKTENEEKIDRNLEKEKQQILANILDVKLKETNSGRNKTKWNVRNKIYKNRRNKKLKKKIRKDFFYSSTRYHEQFEKFLSTSTNIEKEMPEESDRMPEESDKMLEENDKMLEENVKMPEEEKADTMDMKQMEEKIQSIQSTHSDSTNINPIKKTIEIKNKLVSGYIRRFENKKKCPICKKSFKYLEPHMRIHSDKELALLRQISDSKVEEDGESEHVCGICNKRFHHKSTLINHEKLHQKVKKFTCSFCDKSFKDPSTLQRHINIHTRRNLYECDICKKCSYNIKSNLYRHQKVCALKNGNLIHREL